MGGWKRGRVGGGGGWGVGGWERGRVGGVGGWEARGGLNPQVDHSE